MTWAQSTATAAVAAALSVNVTEPFAGVILVTDKAVVSAAALDRKATNFDSVVKAGFVMTTEVPAAAMPTRPIVLIVDTAPGVTGPALAVEKP